MSQRLMRIINVRFCDEPFKRPVTTPCDHTYFRECIEHWFNEGYSSCPTCRSLLSFENLKPVTTYLVLNILDKLLVKCSDCGETRIQRGNFSDHMTKICPTATIHCTAFDIKCPWSGPRDEIHHHLSNCSYENLRPVLSEFISQNRQLVEQVRTLTNQVQVLQSTSKSQVTVRFIFFTFSSSAQFYTTFNYL